MLVDEEDGILGDGTEGWKTLRSEASSPLTMIPPPFLSSINFRMHDNDDGDDELL